MPLQITTRLTSTVQQLARLSFRTVACGLLLTTVRCMAAVSSEPSNLQTITPLEIQHVVHFIGLGDVKPNLTGDLRCGDGKITFVAAGTTTEIPTQAIEAFSIVQDTVPLIPGRAGRVASMAPYGAGMTISMIRNGVDTFTVVYKDSNDAIHGTVFLLPRGKGMMWFALSPH